MAKSQVTPVKTQFSSLSISYWKAKLVMREELPGSNQTRQTKSIKCSILSTYFDFPVRLLITRHFFALLTYAEQMRWEGFGFMIPKRLLK